jgi:hypothetical protein
MNKNIKLAMLENIPSQTMKIINSLMPHIKVINNMKNLPPDTMGEEWNFTEWSKSGKFIYRSLKEWKLTSYSKLSAAGSEVAKLLNQAFEEMNKAKEAFELFQSTPWHEGSPESWQGYWEELSNAIKDSSLKASEKIIRASKYYKTDFSSKELREEYLKQRKRF